jgi:putative FmdB family regulatory protein
MPLYEYVCLDCHTRFERLRASGERDAAVTCPQCAGTRAKRTIAAFATLRATGSTAVAESGGGGCGCGGNCACGRAHTQA